MLLILLLLILLFGFCFWFTLFRLLGLLVIGLFVIVLIFIALESLILSEISFVCPVKTLLKSPFGLLNN